MPPVSSHFIPTYTRIPGATSTPSSVSPMIWTHVPTLDTEIKYLWNIGAGATLNKAFFDYSILATVTIWFVLLNLISRSYYCRLYCQSKIQINDYLKQST